MPCERGGIKTTEVAAEEVLESWSTHQDPSSGQVFYHNTKTSMSSWTPPALYSQGSAQTNHTRMKQPSLAEAAHIKQLEVQLETQRKEDAKKLQETVAQLEWEAKQRIEQETRQEREKLQAEQRQMGRPSRPERIVPGKRVDLGVDADRKGDPAQSGSAE